MKPEAIPTPYDIIPITGTAYVPEVNAWIFLLIAVAMLLLSFFYLRRKEKPRTIEARESYQDQMSRSLSPFLSSNSRNRKELQALCVLVRRYLSSVSNRDCTAMDRRELSQVADGNPGLQPMITHLCSVEELQYAPGEALPPVSELATPFKKALSTAVLTEEAV